MLIAIFYLGVGLILCTVVSVATAVPSFLSPEDKPSPAIAVTQAVAGNGVLACVLGIVGLILALNA